MADVVCNGQWLKGLAGARPSGVSYQDQYGKTAGGGGCWSASWSMKSLDPNYTYDCLATGAHVEVFDHACKVFDGKLDALDRSTMQATAKGQVQYADDYLALMDDGSGNLVASSTPDKVIDRAIAAGWNVKRLDSFGGTGIGNVAYVQRVVNTDTGTMTESTQSINTVGALLTAVALANGLRWGVDADGVIFATKDKTNPDWILVPSTPVPGVTDPQFVTDIYGRYCYGYVQPQKDPTTGAIIVNGYLLYDTTHVTDQASIDLMGETREAPVDLTALGPITGKVFAPGAPNSPASTYVPAAVAAAQANLQGRLNLVGARIGWTGQLTPQWFQLLTTGGSPAPLYMVRGGDLTSIHGVLTPYNQLNFGGHQDVILSATDYAADSSTINADPLDMTSRDFGSVLAAALSSPGSIPDDVDPGNPHWFTA